MKDENLFMVNKLTLIWQFKNVLIVLEHVLLLIQKSYPIPTMLTTL